VLNKHLEEVKVFFQQFNLLQKRVGRQVFSKIFKKIFLIILEEIKQLVEDQPLSTSRILEKEIVLVNGGCVENKFRLQEKSVIQRAFSEWINEFIFF